MDTAMNIDLSDYVAGGYFVMKYTETSDHGFQPSDLLPERIISIRGCRSATFQIYWGWDTEKHKFDVLHFGIANEKLLALSEWINNSHYSETEHPNVFLKADYALNFASEFLDLSNDFIVIGIGLHNDLVDKFLEENDYSHDEKHGLIRLLHERLPLKPEGEILGFEPVGYNINFSCSWLCSGLEKDIHELYDIRPNPYGLIDSYDEAQKATEWINEDRIGHSRGEPDPYYPWLIVQYPVS
jgi:hypothetical protein